MIRQRNLGVPGHEELAISVGRFYQDFEQTGDEEVKELLERATARGPVAQARGGSR
ncbi:MAG: hypothetical protein WEB59_09600 [Thermoanaerobaculia bacterium]